MICQGKLRGLLCEFAKTPHGLEGKDPSLFSVLCGFYFGPTLKAITLSTYYTSSLPRLPEPPTLLLQYDNVEGTCSWTAV